MSDPEDRSVAGIIIECVVGDIASQGGFDAVVNAANAQLRTGGGVAGALHRAAGSGLAREARPLAPMVDRASGLSSVGRIRFVLYDDEARNVFRRALDSALEARS